MTPAGHNFYKRFMGTKTGIANAASGGGATTAIVTIAGAGGGVTDGTVITIAATGLTGTKAATEMKGAGAKL
jgi:hypothetical protein